MNAGILPLLLLAAAFGLALSRVDERRAWTAFALALCAAIATSFVPVSQRSAPILFKALWLSMALTAASVFVPKRAPTAWVFPLAINDGMWAGALTAIAPALMASAIIAVPLCLLFYPGRWLDQRGYGVAVKVAASWLIAIACLSLFVSSLQTPGYVQDHMQ